MKKKNPLYVVTNKGKDVESALNFIDALVKKFNLAPIIEMLKIALSIVKENVNNYATLLGIKKIIDDLLAPLAPLFKIFTV